MAQNQSPAFFAAAAVLLLAAMAPLALAQVLPAQLLPPLQLPLLLPPVGLPIGQLLDMIQINGQLCCTPTGTCPGGPGLAGVNYTMSCRVGTLGSGSGSLVAAFGATGIDGGFNLNLTNIIPTLLSSLGMTVGDLLTGKLPCQILFDLPFDRVRCAALMSLGAGTLSGVPQLVGAAVTAAGIVLNYAVNFAVGGGPPPPQ